MKKLLHDWMSVAQAAGSRVSELENVDSAHKAFEHSPPVLRQRIEPITWIHDRLSDLVVKLVIEPFNQLHLEVGWLVGSELNGQVHGHLMMMSVR